MKKLVLALALMLCATQIAGAQPRDRRGGPDPQLAQDRREAIAGALAMARKGDCVLVAGKGHEATQTLKDRTVEFKDAEVIREILAGMEPA